MKVELDEDVSDWRKPINKLEESRARIDELDELIATLLNERLQLCKEIGEAKKHLGKPVLDDEREREVLARVASAATDPSIAKQLIDVYKTLLSGSRGLQESLKQPSDETISLSESRNPTRYFPQVAIVGLGETGGSIARLLRKCAPKTQITAVDSATVLKQALVDGLIDNAETTPETAIQKVSLVILAAPPDQNLELLAEIAPHLTKRQLVVDITSTRQVICDSAETLELNGADFISASPTVAGDFDNASGSGGKAGIRFGLTSTSKSSQMSVKRFTRWLEGLGIKTEDSN